MNKANTPKISVVIPAYNEAHHIAGTLSALASQETSYSYEVVLVDNNSTDNTDKAAEKLKGKLNLRILHEPTRGRGAARKTGFEAARGEIVCSTDADTIVPANWIETLANYLDQNSKAVAVSGVCHITNATPERVNRQFNRIHPHIMRAYKLVFRHYWLTGSNCAIRKQAYLDAGGFLANAADLEDIELGFRLRKFGKIGFLPKLAVLTDGDRFQGGLMRGLTPYAKMFVQRFFLHQKNVKRD